MNYTIHRVKHKKSWIINSAIVFSVIISAIVNIAMSLFSIKDVYMGDTSGKVDLVKDPFSFVLDLEAVVDMTAVVEYLISGVILGLIIGVVLGVLVCAIRAIAERRRNNNAEDIRACLEPVRPIIADGYAVAAKRIPTASGKKSSGTLVLTQSTLEFYDKDYTAAQKNFLLKLSDITSVRATSCLLANNKITVMTTKASYTFRVPIGTAGDWKRYIKAAM